MKICRACLVTEEYMNLFDEFSVNNYNILTNLNVALLDGMPQYLCQSCGQMIKLFIEFRDKALSSETTLRKFTEESKPDEWVIQINENIGLKNEEKCDEIKQEIKTEMIEEGIHDESNITYSFDTFDTDDFDFCELDNTRVKKIKKQSKSRVIKEDCVGNLTENGKQLFSSCEKEAQHPRKSKRIKKESKAAEQEKSSNVEKNKKESKITEHAKNTLLSCGLCKKQYACKDILATHLDGHKKDGISECGLCGERCFNWPQLLSHRLTHVTTKERTCHVCDTRFVSPLYLEHHYLMSHYEGHDKRLKCKICDRSYDTPRKLNKHIWNIHAQVKYICDYCSKRFVTKTVLRSHMKVHIEKKSYVCDLCGFSCKRSHSLRSHKIRRHAPEKVTCKQCTRAFRDQEHHDAHSCKRRIRICPVCGKECDTSSKMARHMHSHGDINRFKCDRCPASYKTRYALKVHKDRHDGNRTLQCEYCQAKFYSSSVLIKHRRVHTGEKPYVCKICNKGFTGMHNLKVHMQVHGEYTIVRRNKNLEGEEDKKPLNVLQSNPKMSDTSIR